MNGHSCRRVVTGMDNEEVMLKSSQQDLFVKPDQLCVGLFVHLDLNWTKHPFSFSSFKIEKPDQIDTIRKLGLDKIRYSPQKSDCFPLELQTVRRDPAPSVAPSAGGKPVVSGTAETGDRSADDTAAAEAAAAAAQREQAELEARNVDPGFLEKQQKIERMARLADKIVGCEREFMANLRILKAIWQNLFSSPLTVNEQATKLVDGMAESAMMEPEVAVHLVIDHKSNADNYTHAMNVAVLSMVLAKEMGLTLEQMKLIGLGALFHDVACTELPRKLKEKGGTLTSVETEILHQHTKKGVDICNKLQLPYEVLQIVWQHHERVDGSGYPERLRDKQISPLANVVAVADAFDELCNPLNTAKGHTAHESLSIIYAQQRDKFDAKTLTSLVHCMGVYPPGTIVLLSNGFIGMVVAVNPKRPLKPTVLVYDAANLKNQAIVIDIEQEAGISVTKTINPNQLSPEIFEYFSPGKRVSYFFKGINT